MVGQNELCLLARQVGHDQCLGLFRRQGRHLHLGRLFPGVMERGINAGVIVFCFVVGTEVEYPGQKAKTEQTEHPQTGHDGHLTPNRVPILFRGRQSIGLLGHFKENNPDRLCRKQG